MVRARSWRSSRNLETRLSWVRRVIARLRFSQTPPAHRFELSVGSEGLSLQRHRLRDGLIVLEPEWQFAWSDVSAIVGYKVDAYTTDQIRLAFEVRGEAHVVTEDMAGFDRLVAAIEERFDCPRESWWHHVAFPAFDTNWTTIWPRQRMGSSSDDALSTKPQQP